MIMSNIPEYNALTDDFIEKLLNCKKTIISSPKPKAKANYQHKETGMLLESTDNKYKFSVFIREHIGLLEHFSVGLIFHPDNESNLCLIRYNGNHGGHKNQSTGDVIEGFHIHKTTVQAIAMGIRPENQAELTNRYSTLKEAMSAFFTDLNIVNYIDYYPEFLQSDLGLNYDE